MYKNTSYLLVIFFVFISQGIFAQRVFSGKVTDSNNVPLMGVTVQLKGTNIGTATDFDGNYSLKVPKNKAYALSFSYIGFKTKTIQIKENEANKIIDISLEEEVNTIDEVVVTGFVPKAKNSFTGVQVTVTQEELAMVGTKNILSSLSTFVPGMQILQDNNLGSDPNSQPDINIRGRASFEGSSNIPLFIVDGAEVPLSYIYDMDINDIDSATILKDASASALYGARAAAGVIVITTKTPPKGRMRFSYNLTTRLSIPDLSDYHLLNAEQKLEYERRAGLYDKYRDLKDKTEKEQNYAKAYERMRRGINTDWLSKPLRNGFSQNHNLSMDGGDENVRYAVSLRYGNDAGVMKESERERLSSMFKLSYNKSGKYFISNTATISSTKKKDSPYGNFSKYVIQNPYDEPYDKNGNPLRRLSHNKINPLYEASIGNFTKGELFYFSNTLNANVWLWDNIRLDGSFTFLKQKNDDDYFVSPLSEQTNVEEKGKYRQFNSKLTSFAGKLMLSYNQYLTKKLFMTATAGTNGNSVSSEGIAYVARGFYSEKLAFPGFAEGFVGSPNGQEDINRNIGFFINTNFIQDNKYFLDLIYRYEGSSKFGKNQRFAPFWSIGGGWNLHNEKWLKSDNLQNFKLRASIGYLGNINFDSYQSLTTYQYQNNLIYAQHIGATPITIGNPDLKWERTLSSNLGFDLLMFNNRFDFSFDSYVKKTNDLLLGVTKAPSIGIKEKTAKENIGSVENRGLEFQTRYIIITNDDWHWSVSLNYSYNENRIRSISNALKEQNRINAEKAASENRKAEPLNIYEENQSLTAIKAVRSAGIDPAMGNEIYITRDGKHTFVYDPYDQVILGDSAPYGYGNISTFASYKGISLSATFGYSFGGLAYNYTLANRVEGSNPLNNADIRVLQNRWKEPGDIASYKNIADQSVPYLTDRFIQPENYLTLRSLSLSYEFSNEFAKKIYLRRLRIEGLTNDLFYWSTIKQERGLNYPFARSFEISLRATF